MKKWSFIFTLFVCFVTLAGCVEKTILERISLVTLVGYDLEDEKIGATAVIKQVNPEFQSSIVTISNEAYTSKGTRAKANQETSKRVMGGQLRVVLLGEELVKDSIDFTLESLSMSPEFSNSITLAVVEGQAKPLLEYKYENISDVGQHIYLLLEHNIELEQSISSTLHEVTRDYYSPFTDIVMPIIKQEENLIELSSIALFNKDKMVGKLPFSDSFYIKISKANNKLGIIELILDGNDLISSKNSQGNEVPVALDAIRSVRDLKIVDRTKPEFDLNLKITGRLLEIKSNVNLGDPKIIKEIEKAVNKKLTSEISRIIAYAQEVNSDIFGFGEHYKSNVRNSKLTYETWHEMYQEMKVNVHVEFEIKRNGIFE